MKSKSQPQNKPSILLVITLIVGVLALVGCGASDQTTKATQPATQTSVQLAWVHNIEFSGFYAAVKEGYYVEENLDVTLLDGGFDDNGAYIDPVQAVVSGKADFGVAGADVLLPARDQGQPVVAVAAIYQRSPAVLISLKEKNILTPQDLVGKRVMIVPIETTVGVAYDALLEAKNLSHAEINEIPRGSDFTVDPLFNDTADVLPGFITNEAVQAQFRGDVNLMMLSDYGIDIYANVIFTSEDMLKNKPELVEAFVRATTQGMQWAVDNPEAMAQYVVDTYGQSMPQSVQDAQLPGMQAAVPLLNPAGSQPGIMTAHAWEQAHQILLDRNIVSKPLDIDAAYTLTVLEKIYGQSNN